LKFVYELARTSRGGRYAVFTPSKNQRVYGDLWLPISQAGAWEKIIVDATPVNDVMSAVVDRVLECHEIKELRKECGRLRRENERLRSERRSRVEQRALQTAAVVYSD